MPPRKYDTKYYCECSRERRAGQEGCDTCADIDKERFSWANARNSPSMREKELVA